MAGNTFGQAFKIMTFGESHGEAIGVIIDGCPAGLAIDESFIQQELDRRRPGQSAIVTKGRKPTRYRSCQEYLKEKHRNSHFHGDFNADARSKDYGHIAEKFRPSHADYTYWAKFGIRDYRGGGRSSARETAARVAAGAIAKILLSEQDIQINAYVSQVRPLQLQTAYHEIDFNLVESNPVRCPDLGMAKKWRI